MKHLPFSKTITLCGRNTSDVLEVVDNIHDANCAGCRITFEELVCKGCGAHIFDGEADEHDGHEEGV